MTTYRLRDRKLQQKLDELSHFSEMLKTMGRFLVKKQATNVQLGESRFTVTLFREDIEIAPEYDPNDWNAYPDVTPPEGVLMLVECIDEDDKTFKTCAEYVGDGYGAYYWRNEYEIDVPVKRFRPLE